MAWLWQAVVLFAVTNIDDMVVLSLFFGRARGDRRSAIGVVIGQYIGFAVILTVSIAGGAVGALLPHRATSYLGLVPIGIGLWAGWRTWRERGAGPESAPARISVLAVASVTVANGGDNLGVYVPVFAEKSTAVVVGFAVVFLMLVAVWCTAGYLMTAHHRVAEQLDRWGSVIYPVALIVVGLVILVGGGAFGVSS